MEHIIRESKSVVFELFGREYEAVFMVNVIVDNKNRLQYTECERWYLYGYNENGYESVLKETEDKYMPDDIQGFYEQFLKEVEVKYA
jgi:hypothetical protein